jgi:hypothetical protein
MAEDANRGVVSVTPTDATVVGESSGETTELVESKPLSTSSTLPQPLLHALEMIPDKEAKAILAVALSKTTYGFGTDPETAKTMAEAEMHEEECRLKAFQAQLVNREQQAVRDHDFRKKKLNHSTTLLVVILIVTIGGVGGGLVLSSTGNPALGNPVLTASLTMLSALAGKLLSSRDKD